MTEENVKNERYRKKLIQNGLSQGPARRVTLKSLKRRAENEHKVSLHSFEIRKQQQGYLR